ncbi:MAG: hypothetical protein LRY71_12895 [Bacillaceae bacterium]|nr:hypothetical protein [Bacillaceae bacterium]
MKKFIKFTIFILFILFVMQLLPLSSKENQTGAGDICGLAYQKLRSRIKN